ncbi:MAG TPA: RluA family pseudouridine synthase [Desulfuromonadaceae bacterium]|nr:RluA family pseudouridine synthase [Desulfuromonadaceae bacterium]
MLNVVHEDADLLVVNKPAGLVCHPTKNGEMSSLIGRARLYLGSGISGLGSGDSIPSPSPQTPDPKPNPPNPGLQTQDPRPYLVNRLDRETSGIVLIAKNAAAAGELGKALENRAVQKEYQAIVHGHVGDNHGVIDAPLGKDDHSIVAVKDRVRPDGTPARTEYFVERHFSVGVHALACQADKLKLELQHDSALPFTLLRIAPHTGRKHQIRIHLAHVGHPIVGDKLYGHDEDCYLALVQDRLTMEQRRRLIFENHALHARLIRFEWRGQVREFSCEPEPWFKEFVERTKKL